MKLKINNEQLADDFFDGCRLMGIVASVKPYQFNWQLNQALGFQFRANNDIEIQLTKKNRTYFFSVYEYPVPARTLVHYLYCNQHEGEYLLPEFRHLDYLWLTRHDWLDEEELQSLLQSVRRMPAVQLVNEMTHEKIKNKQHLIL